MKRIAEIAGTVSFRAALKLVALAIPLLTVVAWCVVASTVDDVEDSMISRGKIAAAAGASSYGVILDLGIRNGAIRIEDLLAPAYTPIAYAPALHVEETRFHTQFDNWIDASGIQRMEDQIRGSSSDILYAVGADIGAYVPVTHAEYSQPPTGDAARDRKWFRSKRKFNLPMHVAASLWEGNTPLVQEYHRDTGDLAWDIAAPIYVHDPVTGKPHHFGCFRLGIMQEQIAASRRVAAIYLIELFVGLLLVLALCMFLSLRRTMRPLVRLSDQATQISLGGQDMRTPVTVASGASEIGGMARSLERLRRSMVAAMERIG